MSERLTRLPDGAARGGTAVAVPFVDPDGFEQISDGQGYWVGDRVLRAVAERLADRGVEAAGLARWGGDEFVIVTTRQADQAGAMALAHAIRTSVANAFDTGMHTMRVGS